MTIGERIKMLCNEKQIKQKDLAQATGYTGASVTRWINDDRTCRADALVEVAKYFDVSTDYLLGLSEERNGRKREVADDLLEYCEQASKRAEELMMKCLEFDGKEPQKVAEMCMGYKFFEHEFCEWKYTIPSVIREIAEGRSK